ncbi:TonB-dependent receptor plug domain-containing protein [Alteromonas abrolhosensis]|jgi:outer membrane receptor protein involved in Fe transport|uniref:TonB-dependent receptor plug domain-containing protein n=1 Tax=Alteromonas abrolhosensis TaxID=1892904 RepID=UPI00096B7335|nr:TonB-dependent receptor [Alteromonas abrolhosensis]
MFTNHKLAKSVRLACAFGAAASLAFSGSIYAQDEVESEEEPVEKIEVTGSRLLSNPNVAAATPVLSVSGAEAAARGNLRVEDFVNVLPQVFAGQASEVSNGSTGTATLNLRGLGANRTLVLIDGKRLPYGSSGTSAANVDLVPTQMLERVDILTGGASAVYGSDAVGGVANFILRDDFEGVEFGGQFSTNYADNDNGLYEGVLNAAEQPVPGSTMDGDETLIYTMFGASSADGKGNVTIYASYEDRQEIVQADRVFSACTLGQSNGASSFEGFGCVGSANFRLFGGPGGFAFQEENGNIIPYAGGPTQTYNFGATNFFQRPSERYHFYAKGDYELAEDLEAYADFSYINNTSDAQIAPSASFGIGAYDINCGNPYIQGNSGIAFTDIFGCSADDIANDVIVSGITASHRNVEGGSRNSRLENSAWRFVGGLNGFIDDIWAWNVFGQISETRDQSSATNDFVVANLQQALLATTDENGNVVCLDQSGGCVPYNIFQRPGGESSVTQEQLDFIQGIGIVNGETSQKVFGADIQANLGDYGIKIPTADDGIGVLFGIEYRKDELASSPDEISQVQGGGFTGVGGATLAVAGKIEVREFFTEVQVPLVSGAEFAEELVFSAQYRFSDYDADGNGTSNSFDTNAYGYQLAWTPVDDVKLRAQFQRAVRAPNVIDLFTGQNTGLPNLSPAGVDANGEQLYDPCAGSNPIASLETCARTGVTAAQYGNILDVISGQTQSLTGGNPQLSPETADTVTFGVVITPASIEGLSISVDYFDIEVEDAIASGIPAQTIFDNCLETGDPTFCNLITRSSAGSLAAGTFGVGFQQTNLNIATLKTSGLDVQIGYNFDTELGDVRFDYAATMLDELSTVPFPGGDTVECAGFFGNACGAPNPEYRHRFMATWNTNLDIDITATWRHFGTTDNDDDGDTLETGFKAINYLDISATYFMNDNLEFTLGVLNLLGEQPPVYSGAGPALGNGNTYPTVYDTSTNWFASFRGKF